MFFRTKSSEDNKQNIYTEKAVSFCQSTVVYLDKNTLKTLNNCYPPLQNLLRCLLSLIFYRLHILSDQWATCWITLASEGGGGTA